MKRFGVRKKPLGRARERKVTVYLDATDERAVTVLQERLPRSMAGDPTPVSTIYALALRRLLEEDYPEAYARLYAKADHNVPAKV